MKRNTRRLVKALKRRAMTTKEVRDQLGIGDVASAVKNARANGCSIMTELIVVRNRYGEKCNCAKYFLVSYPARVADECGIKRQRPLRHPARKKAA